jgi:hypothetical protein
MRRLKIKLGKIEMYCMHPGMFLIAHVRITHVLKRDIKVLYEEEGKVKKNRLSWRDNVAIEI